MMMWNVLTVVVFMSLRTLNLIQAETIRGVDIPDLDVSGIVGNWYVLASATENDQITCTTMSFEQESGNDFTMNSTFVMSPDSMQETYSLVFDCMIDRDSNIITCEKDDPDDLLIVLVFDVNYDSYLAMYTTSTTDRVYSGDDGYVFILSRQTTIPDGVLEKVEQSNFYKEGMMPGDDLNLQNTSGC